MSTPLALEQRRGARLGRSALAFVAAIVVTAGLSLATDQLLHALGVYPPWGQPMYEPALNALALGYRLVYGVVGGAVVARLAPRAPIWHAAILGIFGLVVSAIGVVVATRHDLGPLWYPASLAVLSPLAGLLGAVWYVRRRRP